MKNLCKTYYGNGVEFEALVNINLQINEGEFISIVGESGSGKSTLARMILGLEKPDGGAVEINGQNIFGCNEKIRKALKKDIQAVFQDATGTLNPKVSVYGNVTEALVNLTNLNKTQRKERIYELMKITNMDISLLKVPTRQLSGGEQRRLSLLRALSIRPSFLVIDEVISGLDLISADAVMKVLEIYHKEYNCGCLFITHDKKSAYRLSDRILIMERGQIVNKGTRII